MFVCILRHFKRYSERGNVLLSTILIMGLALNIGLMIAVLSLGGFSRTKNIKSQALSYYAAESGAETGLYQIRKSGQEIENFNLNVNTDIGTNWQTTATTTTSIIQDDLEEDQSLVLYLYNPDTWQSGISTLRITWQDTCNMGSALDVAKIYPVDNQTEFNNLDWDNPTELQNFLRNDSLIISNDGAILPLRPEFAYAIKITAKDCYVNFLKIEGKDSNDNVVKLNLESIITTTGSFGNVKQTIRVSM